METAGPGSGLGLDTGHGAARRPGRRPRGVVGQGLQPRGGRGGQGDHRRLRARDRQAGRARLPSAGGASGQDRSGARGGPAARLRLRHLLAGVRRAMGVRRSAGRTSRTPSGPSRTCSIRMHSPACDAATGRPGRRPCTGCRSVASSNHVHVWKSLLERAGFSLADIPASGTRSGRSGATGCSRRCARPRAATTSGASVSMSVERHRHDGPVRSVRGRLRRRLCDPRRQARHRRSGDQAKAGQGHGQLYGDLPQGLHPAGFGELGRQRQQPGVPDPDGRHDTKRSLSIPNALKRDRPDDYYKNTATSSGRLARMASPFRSRVASFLRSSSRTAATSPPPRSSFASSSARAGWRTISTSPASVSCRRCRSCSTSRSGSTRATRTAWRQ